MKKGSYSKFIVTLVVMLNVIFTAAVLYISLKGYNAPDSLIAAWFSFTTVELLSLAYIKNQKIKKGGNKGE